MPRAGSELLQVLLHQNPRIYGSTTSPLLEYQYGARQNYNLPEVKSQDPVLMQKAFINMCGAMAKGYYEVITDRPIISEKNRGWSHYNSWVEQWNPDAKMICVVRDLRDIIASFERIYRANRHNPECPDLPAEMRSMTVEQRTHHWLNTQPVGLALSRTLDSFQRDLGDKIHFVRYEDLCNDPQPTMDKLYDFIGEKRFKHNFDNIIKEVYEDDSNFGIFGSHKVHTTLKPCKAGKWRDVLSEPIAAQIRQHSPWYFDKFGY